MLDSFIAGCISGIVQTIIGYPLDTLKVRQQNITKSRSNLFAGMKYPLIQTPFLTGVCFFTDNIMFNYTNNMYLSGAFSGLVSSIIICPLDYYKIQQQEQKKICINKSNILYSFKHINITISREVPAYFILFSTYRTLQDNNVNTFMSGGIAGALSWLLTYPQDTVKSRLQSNKAHNIMEALRMGKLFTGIQFCLYRAFLVNSVGFIVYKNCM